VDECETFVVLFQHLEQVLLGLGEKLDSHPKCDELLKALSALLTRALQAIRPLAKPNFDVDSADVALFPELCGELYDVASKLEAPLKIALMDSGSAKTHVAVDELKQELAVQQVAISDGEKTRVLERQNHLLRLQSKQMEAMFEHHGVDSDEFMQRFPLPDNEAERLEVVSKLGVMTVKLPNHEVEAIVDETIEEGILGGCLTVCYVIVMAESVLRILAMRTRNEDGHFIGHSTQSLPLVPRKVVPCQYSIATGKMTCFRRTSQDDAAKVDPVGAMMGYEKALTEVDFGFSAEVKQSFMRQCDPVVQRMRDLHMSHLGTGVTPLSFIYHRLCDKLVGPPNVMHVGFPIRALGQVVGTFCCMFSGLEEAEPSSAQVSFIEGQALRMGRVLESTPCQQLNDCI